MSLFDLLIVQPIFNVLVLIYGLLPGGDFGIAVILFTVLIRLLMWPLVKKQLHQTKAMRAIQPELKKIKAKAKGNKTLEGQLMLELYRERGINPFSSIGLLLVQLPIFIALYQVINIITSQRDRIAQFTYEPLEGLDSIAAIIADPAGFNESLLGVINLAARAYENGAIYLPIVFLAILAALLQYYQARQTMPKQEDGKRLRDILKEQAAGKEVDQSDVTAAVSNKMVGLIPFMTLAIGLFLPGALVLYFAAQSAVAIIQQHIILNQDVDEMETMADKGGKAARKKSASDVTVRRLTAQEAEIVTDDTETEDDTSTTPTSPNKKKQPAKKRRKRR